MERGGSEQGKGIKMPHGEKRCKSCNREYEVGVGGDLCSDSCRLVHWGHYLAELRELSWKVYRKYWK